MLNGRLMAFVAIFISGFYYLQQGKWPAILSFGFGPLTVYHNQAIEQVLRKDEPVIVDHVIDNQPPNKPDCCCNK